MKTIGRRILILNIMLLVFMLSCLGGTAFADEYTSDTPTQDEYTSDGSVSDSSSQDEYTSDGNVSDGSSQDEYISDGSVSDGSSQDEYTEPGIQDELIISSVNYQDGVIKVPAYYNYIYIDIEYLSSRDQQITITSSDESVISVPTKSIDVAQSVADEYYEYTYINVTTGNCGIAELTFRLGEDEVKIPVIVLPERVNTIYFPEQVGLARQKIQWEPLPGADGYLIKKYQDAEDSSYLKYDEGEIIKKITDGNTASVVVDSSWNEKGFYLVEPYVMFNGEMLTGESEYAVYNAHHFETLPVSLPLKNVKRKTSTSFEISWNISDEAPTYKLYRSNYENNKYKLIGTYDNSAATSGTITVTDKVKAGNTYFYKLVTVMDGKKAASYSTFASMIPKKLKTKKITSKAMANSVDFYQYQEGSYTKVVALEGRWGIEPRIKIYTFNKNHKLKSTKTINYIKKYKCQIFGGAYHGPDGNNYLALGNYNSEESRTKTVIKVIKFDKNWKYVKTAKIKANVSNSFEGIVEPFRAGTVAFDMLGNKLYMFTARTMFVHDDGLNHQSNIAFEINTKTMKAKERNVSYCSHSFDQFARFKDGNLYLADHGDAYPRSIKVSIADNYGQANESIRSYEPFDFLGETGDNATGASLNGFEVSKNNILVAAASQPHNYKIKGTKGFGTYSRNLLLTITNRKTGESKVKWLTKYDPKASKTIKGVWMKKLTDKRFAIIYAVGIMSSEKESLYYLVVDENGKKLYKTQLKGLKRPQTRELILKDGRIWWFNNTPDSIEYVYKNGKYVDKKIKGKSTFYGVPAVWE